MIMTSSQTFYSPHTMTRQFLWLSLLVVWIMSNANDMPLTFAFSLSTSSSRSRSRSRSSPTYSSKYNNNRSSSSNFLNFPKRHSSLCTPTFLSFHDDWEKEKKVHIHMESSSPLSWSSSRQSFFHWTITTTSSLLLSTLGNASKAMAQEYNHNYNNNNKDQEEGYESIAARASQMAKLENMKEEASSSSTTVTTSTTGNPKASTSSKVAAATTTIDTRTIYDFSLPIAGINVPLLDLLQQEFYEENKRTKTKEDGSSILSLEEPQEVKRDARVKAILVVNIKQDDPVARKNIPELISLAAKFGRSGDFAVICSPTDQGYFEADTSALIRLKLASEYGYGINPSTIITDKVNLLGTGAHPFWRWIEGSCRAPSGLGRIQGNFEKFLVDGRTGKPLRRYPRQYQPFDIAEDIDAIIKGKPLPPAGANWREEWRSSDKDAEKDVYRFQKGLNFYDQ